MTYQIACTDLQKVTLNETDLVKSVKQNVAIILSTFQKSAPLYRAFGIDGSFIDKPIAVAEQMLIAEVREVVEAYEPRVTVMGISFEKNPDEQGKLIPVVEVNINE